MSDRGSSVGRGRAADLFDGILAGGEKEIQRFIDEQVSEELFIDYKRVTNDGNSQKLETPDKENLARAIAGFGNSEGGIIVWGVDCRNDPQRGDIPTAKFPIQKVNRFLSYLEGATSGCTLPPHGGVRHHLVSSERQEDGFVVTFVPKSMFAPHQCIVRGRYEGRYYIRVGSNFQQAPHGLLASMFGRRPSPNIFHVWRCAGEMTPSSWAPVITHRPTSTPLVRLAAFIRNHGVTVARDVYMNFQIFVPGPNCMAEMANRDSSFAFSESLGIWHFISADEYRLAPAAMVAPFELVLYLRPPFEEPLDYEYSFGCEGSPVLRLQRTISAASVRQAHDAYLNSDRSRKTGVDFAKAVFDLDRAPEYSGEVEF